MLKIPYIKRPDNRASENTNNMYKHMSKYSTDFFNSYNIKTHNVKKPYYNFANDVVVGKHDTIDTNDTYNVTKINKLVNF